MHLKIGVGKFVNWIAIIVNLDPELLIVPALKTHFQSFLVLNPAWRKNLNCSSEGKTLVCCVKVARKILGDQKTCL